MAAKVLFILGLVAAVAYAADTECKCDLPSDSDNSALWEFLKSMSEQEPGLDDNQRLDAVLPAVLSPLLECNCLQDKSRRKRKVMPDVSEETFLSEESLAQRRDPKCPHGTVWFGIMCVSEQFVMDK